MCETKQLLVHLSFARLRAELNIGRNKKAQLSKCSSLYTYPSFIIEKRDVLILKEEFVRLFIVAASNRTNVPLPKGCCWCRMSDLSLAACDNDEYFEALLESICNCSVVTTTGYVSYSLRCEHVYQEVHFTRYDGTITVKFSVFDLEGFECFSALF